MKLDYTTKFDEDHGIFSDRFAIDELDAFDKRNAEHFK